jgi:hypothetical protein
MRRGVATGKSGDEMNRASDERSLETVIYPLASQRGYGTIPCIGLTGVTQQIVIASRNMVSLEGHFVRAIAVLRASFRSRHETVCG